MKKLLNKKYWIPAAVALVLLIAGLLIFSGNGKNGAAKQIDASQPDRIYKIKRSDLTIGVMLSGSVNAKKKHKLAMEAPYKTKLVKVVDENKKVSADERVAEYETYDLQLKIDDLKVLLDNKKKDLEIALEELEILKSTNDADIRTAHDNVSDAEDAYNKYWRLEGPRDKDTKKMNISDAEKELTDAKSNHNELKTTFNNTVYSDDAAEKKAKQGVETAKQKVSSLETKYESAVLEWKIFKRYTYPNKIKSLKNALIQAKLNLNKTKVKTQSSLLQKNNQIFQIKTSIRNYDRDLERHLSYLPMMVLTAPVDGIVTYGDPDRRWGNPEVKVGMDAHRKQVIITIPDMSKMIVDVNLPEQYRSKVSKGDKVIVTPDSIQTIKLRGVIDHIAVLPVNLIPWDQNSPKIYRTVVEFLDFDKRVVSGMSVQVEVISKILKKVLYIPIEAVFEEGGKLIVYRKTFGGPEKTQIIIGESNNNYVEIKKGLAEGDEVFLYRPFQTESK